MITTRGLGPTVRVASLPWGEVLELGTAARLGGLPNPDGLPTPTGGAARLPEDWLATVGPRVDVAHVHVGLAAVEPATLAATLAGLERLGVPVLATVHDLGSVGGGDRAGVEDEIVTLVLDAAYDVVAPSVPLARELLERWGRSAHVLPLPGSVGSMTRSGGPGSVPPVLEDPGYLVLGYRELYVALAAERQGSAAGAGGPALAPPRLTPS